jgi:RNA polymerase sigma factor (sigma-70 family)
MQAADDIELVRKYASEKSEEAFAAVVSRHIKLVYSSAMRQVRDPHLAEEVTQSVFVLLAQKAATIKKESVLAGWLYRATGYVAADALRSERRRQHRETAAMEPLYAPRENSPWQEIEPMLDRAMNELPDGERNLVLLRFFENKSLKDVGAAMGISEDAAQKRVARALEKLRDIFARRGAAVSSTALATALGAFAAQSAPPALAASVVALATTATAPVAISLLTQATIKFMAMTKLKAAAVVVALAAVSVPYVSQQHTLSELRKENENLKAAFVAPQAEPQPVAGQISPAEIEQLKRDAAEVPRLRGQIAALTQERSQPAAMRAKQMAPSDPNAAASKDPMDRQALANKLVLEGKFPEALEHFLWCYDEGAKNSPSYVGVRGSFLLNQIKDLASKYPPAQEALLARRDGLEKSIKDSSSANPMTIQSLIQLNDALGEPIETMGFFDELPATHPARGALVNQAGDQFLRASRYQDIVGAGNPEAAFDMALMVAKNTNEHVKDNEALQSIMRRRVVEAGGRGLEALSGVGQVERATALAEKILTYDNSPETRGELLKYAQRATNQAVVAYIKSR